MCSPSRCSVKDKVGGSVQVVLGLDDEAPSGPDHAGAGQGEELCKGQLLGGTGEVRDTGDDESPLCEVSVTLHFDSFEQLKQEYLSSWVGDVVVQPTFMTGALEANEC